MESRPVIQFPDESHGSRLAKKAKEEPFVPIGTVLLFYLLTFIQ